MLSFGTQNYASLSRLIRYLRVSLSAKTQKKNKQVFGWDWRKLLQTSNLLVGIWNVRLIEGLIYEGREMVSNKLQGESVLAIIDSELVKKLSCWCQF